MCAEISQKDTKGKGNNFVFGGLGRSDTNRRTIDNSRVFESFTQLANMFARQATLLKIRASTAIHCDGIITVMGRIFYNGGSSLFVKFNKVYILKFSTIYGVLLVCVITHIITHFQLLLAVFLSAVPLVVLEAEETFFDTEFKTVFLYFSFNSETVASVSLVLEERRRNIINSFSNASRTSGSKSK